MGKAKGSGWTLTLAVSPAALPFFEAALEALGGALVVGGPEAGRVPITVYLAVRPKKPDMTALLTPAAAAAGVGLPDFRIEALPDLDWVAESQKALPPIRAGRFYIFGSHVDKRPPAASIPILIDANTAFGTGRHESTRGCLLALSLIAKRRRFGRPLDLGCGSGVLAIAMAKLRPVSVVAADNDRTALAVARTNARLNGVAARVRPVASDGYRSAALAQGGPYDLIVANILAEPLAAMAGGLARHLAPGGLAVLSGLLTRQERLVLVPHRLHGLRLVGRLRIGEWSTLVLKQKNARRLPS